MKYYALSHEWVEIDPSNQEIGTVGISDQAQQELGEIVYLELPKIGEQVQQGQEAAVVESTKAATDLYAPVSGEVVAVNEQATRETSLINESAESTGWLFQVKLTSLEELKELVSEEEYCQNSSKSK